MGRRRRATRPGLSCADVVELITDYVEGALAPDVAAQVSVHLSGCEGCTVYLDQVRVTAAAVRDVDLPGLPDDACEELLDAFRDFGLAERPPHHAARIDLISLPKADQARQPLPEITASAYVRRHQQPTTGEMP